MKSHQILKKVFLLLVISGFILTSCSVEEFSDGQTTTDVSDNKASNPLADKITNKGWADSFSVNGKCYCRSTYDHGIGEVKVGNRTVRSICEAMKQEMQKALNGNGKKVFYNTVQCGHEPAHRDKTIFANGQKHADEVLCPGVVGTGIKCNSRKGPKWNLGGNGNNGNNKIPSVSFITPFNNATFKEGYTKMVVSVNASDSDGSVTEVKLYMDNKLIRVQKNAPYRWGEGANASETLGLSKGSHILKVEAKDNKGAVRTITRTFTVKTANGSNNFNGTISFANPSGNTTLNRGYTNFYIKAKTSGNIQQVSLYIDGKFIRTERVAPYEWGNGSRKETTGLNTGNHTFKLVAQDANGNQKESTIQVIVRN
ncbi:Ig-like domain-containing protein [Aquimarina sp. ERC-38]|uniref:Ig-like domain-containing protein n=1 Tax=Aquimarina sp. ERC-38 TaxID=2949996 RepID=UPI002247A676|nr:Ig-like domain-containing protein [Aquimarina sp. ERC-38]UZO81567.1 Ig-like domain-containing protein [Aquimarina sp. ERC-38]